MADLQRTTRWLLVAVALLTVTAAAGLAAFVLLAAPDARMHPVAAATVILHTGGAYRRRIPAAHTGGAYRRRIPAAGLTCGWTAGKP